jgi:hypothetical protein
VKSILEDRCSWTVQARNGVQSLGIRQGTRSAGLDPLGTANAPTGSMLATSCPVDLLTVQANKAVRTMDPSAYSLHWGDFHKHMTGPGTDRTELDDIVSHARQHLDVVSVHCYPFKMYRKGRDRGIREESVGHDPDFDEWWEEVQRASAAHNDPGSFVTFPAYEWHGNRAQWGDHNVYYREEGEPIDATWDLPDLLENMASRRALVLPHHTGYDVGNRGKDWDCFDSDLMPVSEIYSSHGSNEAVDSPVAMDANRSMGPRTTGSTYQDALDQGHRIGVVASNDGPGFPGTWGKGIAGIWAPDLSRESIWEALRERRTYGVTGDRIRLWWTLNGRPMGSAITSASDPEASVSVDCPRPLGRVELVHNGNVTAVHSHQTREHDVDTERYRLLLEFGWGPTPEYGDFDDVECEWSGMIWAADGELTRVSPRFTGFGQRYSVENDGIEFDLRTTRDSSSGVLPEGQADTSKQGLAIEVDGDDNTEIRIELDGQERIEVPLSTARTESRVVAFLDESWERIGDQFDLAHDDIENPDPVYHNARKVRVSRAAPQAACTADVTFDELPVTDGLDYYYVRAAQVDGQYAWSSPIWVES